jgi:hypothetical protein
VWPFLLRRGRADKLVIGPDLEWFRYLIGKRRDQTRLNGLEDDLDNISNDSYLFPDSESDKADLSPKDLNHKRMKFTEEELKRNLRQLYDAHDPDDVGLLYGTECDDILYQSLMGIGLDVKDLSRDEVRAIYGLNDYEKERVRWIDIYPVVL